MKIMNRTGLLLFSLSCSSVFFSAAFAQSATQFQCTSGNLVRRVEVVYESAAAVPCEVHYIKETEGPGSREVLWNAASESGYCEARAQELLERLGGFGWSCTDAATAEADDSAVLTPAESQE